MNHPILLLIVACGLVAAVWSGCGGVDAPETEAYQCIPQCEGKQCGDDGCGGTCGECEAGYECVTMSCTFEGGYCFSYEVDCPVYCEGQGAECGEVNTANAEGSPVCDCGTCPPGQACINNETMDELGGQHCCTPSCTAKECGDDGCGGVCGDCPPDQPCVYGYCCVPYCGQENEAECGDDGCGGSCGECAPGEVCGEADYDAIGVCFDMVKDCAEICLVQKPTGTCGPVWTGLRSPEDCECGCPGVQDECIDYKCVCQPSCAGKQCGDDGCGGSCGMCPQDPCLDSCVDGLCAPSAVGPEACDGIDNDCDGKIDEDFPDLGGSCEQPSPPDPCDPLADGHWVCSEDGLALVCVPKTLPEGYEVCDGLDNNCNGQVDEGYPDTDQDGLADCVDQDDDNDGDPDETDCAPLVPSIYHGAPEACDGIDNNCDGKIDEGYPDTNGDGIADCSETGWDSDDDGDPDLTDCAPEDPTVHHGAVEVCDGIDNDCDGQVDEGCPCSPDCKDKVCGDDGCSGSCGTCPEGTKCNESGKCE